MNQSKRVAFLASRWTLVAMLMLAASFLTAQGGRSDASAHRPGAGATGYLPGGEVNIERILPPYPERQSIADTVDVAALRGWQQPEGSARLQLARADAEISYSRFNEAFGSEISAAKTPLLVHLLDRAQADASEPLGQGKRVYHRPRPYQRLAFEHVCAFEKPPAPDCSTTGVSYPSGHTTFAWTAVLILVMTAPERAQSLLARAQEYGESRLVCAMHYPSDVAAGRTLASYVVARVSATPEFQRDLGCAREEREVAAHTRPQLDASCQALLASIH